MEAIEPWMKGKLIERIFAGQVGLRVIYVITHAQSLEAVGRD
jgi:hypothetical protein